MDVSGESTGSTSPLATKGVGAPAVPNMSRSHKQALKQRPGPVGNKTGKGAQDIHQFFELSGTRRYCQFCRYVLQFLFYLL